MDMRFGTWNVRSMYRVGSLRAIAEEMSKYNFDFVGVQEIRWDGGGTEPAGEYTFFYGNGNENHELGTGFFIHKRIMKVSPNKIKLKLNWQLESDKIVQMFLNCHI
jgi:exonuclease III